MKKMTYKSSGVDIDAGNAFVRDIQSSVRSTFVDGVCLTKAGFGGLFSLKPGEYKDPVMVSSTDGVGTKLLIAQANQVHDTVGIDLVAMNVNDILCVGAKPLFFLDYIACGKLDRKVLADVVKGIARGCRQAGCALIGGETAEMPDLYAKDEYDLAGFTVGVVERSRIIDGSRIREGDAVIGLPSSGIHSNGYSLVRKVVFEIAGLGVNDAIDELGETVGQALLRPTRIYVRPVRKVLGHYKVKNVVHGLAHITGGGLHENLERIVPEGARVVIDRDSWPVPPVFAWLQRLGPIEQSEMDQVFNNGVGMVMVVSPFFAESIRHQLADYGVESWTIGRVEEGPRGVVWAGA